MSENNVQAPVEEKKEEQQKTLKQKVLEEIRGWVVALVGAFAIIFIMKSFFFMPIMVDGDSMNPTLTNGQRLGVTVYDVKLTNGLQRGDIVICNYPGSDEKTHMRVSKDPILHLFTVKTNFVKRLVGLPGDTVKRVRDVTYINDEPLDPSAFNPYTKTPDYEYVLGEDEYFVVGDNRYHSHDSRAWNGPNYELHLTNDATGQVGPITRDMIVGRARFIFWPLSEITSLESDPTYVDPKDVREG